MLVTLLQKESVVVEEMKEVELRSRGAHFIYDRNFFETWNLTKSNSIQVLIFITEFEKGYWRSLFLVQGNLQGRS